MNIAGGPAMDSLNALIVLRRGNRPGVLDGRRIQIDVLDRDGDGPAFGARALTALRAEGRPCTASTFSYVISAPTGPRPALCGISSAPRASGPGDRRLVGGGLFEYGTDAEIEANLDCLRDEAPSHFVMVGSVTRADEPVQRLRETSRAATRPRGCRLSARWRPAAGGASPARSSGRSAIRWCSPAPPETAG